MKIVTDRAKLKKMVFAKPLSVDEVNTISDTLREQVIEHNGNGLAANQLGLNDRVCIINVKEQLVLVNPVIIGTSKDTVAWAEQCLSLPKTMKTPVKTVRFKKIRINTDNLGEIEFGPDLEQWKDSHEFFGDEGMLECACAQHEIDLLDGILITDSKRRYTTTFIAPKKYGRNEKVMVKLPDGSTEFVKYKKAIPMLQMGCEIL